MLIAMNSTLKKRILETSRLILRVMNDGDYKSLQAVISDPETMKYYQKPYDEAGVQKWIDWCKASQAKRGFSLWSVILKETGQMIGDCGVSMQIIDDEMSKRAGDKWDKIKPNKEVHWTDANRWEKD